MKQQKYKVISEKGIRISPLCRIVKTANDYDKIDFLINYHEKTANLKEHLLISIPFGEEFTIIVRSHDLEYQYCEDEQEFLDRIINSLKKHIIMIDSNEK